MESISWWPLKRYHSIDFFGGSRTARGSTSSEEESPKEDRTSQKRGQLRRSRKSSRKNAIRGNWKPCRVRKVRNLSWLLAKQTGGRCFREARTCIWRLGVLTTATRRSLVRSLASHDRLTQTHGVARVHDVTTFILKPSHALLDDHTLWDPINEPEISQRPLIKHGNRILGECSEEWSESIVLRKLRDLRERSQSALSVTDNALLYRRDKLSARDKCRAAIFFSPFTVHPFFTLTLIF